MSWFKKILRNWFGFGAPPPPPSKELPPQPRLVYSAPGNSMPSRAEMEAARRAATAKSPCHDKRCPGHGKHRCHDLSCPVHHRAKVS